MSSPRTTARAALLLAVFALTAGSAAARPDNLPPPPGGQPAKGPQPALADVVQNFTFPASAATASARFGAMMSLP